MKTIKMPKVQPEAIRAYSACPEVRSFVKKMGWHDMRPAGYLVALAGLEAEGSFTTHLDNILLALSDVSPTLTTSKQSVRISIAKAEKAGTIRKTGTSNHGKHQHYALTDYGYEVVAGIRTAVDAFAEWERKLPQGRYAPSVTITKSKQIKALTEENVTLNAVSNEQARVIREQDVRIYELEMLVASLTRP